MVQHYKAYDEYDNIVHIDETINRSKHARYYMFKNKRLELIAKRGEIKAWHFAIKPIEKVQNSGAGISTCESELHSIMKHYIADGCLKYISSKSRIVLKVKPLIYSSVFGENILYNLLQDVDSVKVEEPYKGYKPDITLYKDGKVTRVIEVVNEHDIDEDGALTLYRSDKIDVVIVDVSKFTDENISSLINNTRDGIITFKEWFRSKSKVHVYLNKVNYSGDFSERINNLKVDYSKLTVDADKLNSDYKVLLSDLKSNIDSVKLVYYTCEDLDALKIDVNTAVLEMNSLCEDYKSLIKDLKETVSRANRLVGYNKNLSRYWVKSDKQYLIELEKKKEILRQQREAEVERLMIVQYYENLKQEEIRKKEAIKLEEERKRKEEADKKNTVRKHVNKRAAQVYKNGVSSLEFFSIASEHKQGMAILNNNLVTDDEGFEKFLKEEGY